MYVLRKSICVVFLKGLYVFYIEGEVNVFCRDWFEKSYFFYLLKSVTINECSFGHLICWTLQRFQTEMSFWWMALIWYLEATRVLLCLWHGSVVLFSLISVLFAVTTTNICREFYVTLFFLLVKCLTFTDGLFTEAEIPERIGKLVTYAEIPAFYEGTLCKVF